MGDTGRGSRRYALCVFEGTPRLKLRMPDEGIALTGAGLAWRIGGVERARRHADIRKVLLSVAHLHNVGTVGNCRIRFADGAVLNVVSSTSWGYAEDARSALYARFLHDLHAELTAHGHRGIAFRAGDTEGRQALGRLALVLAAGFFVALPVGLALFLGAWEALLLAAVGGGLVWPLSRTLRANEPRAYFPERLPDDLLP